MYGTCLEMSGMHILPVPVLINHLNDPDDEQRRIMQNDRVNKFFFALL